MPGDFSSAAPFIVAATLVPGSELHIHGVNLNPRRTGLLDVLERMGARVTVYNRRRIGGEPAGDLEVRSAELVATTVDGAGGAARDRRAAALRARRARARTATAVVRGAEELRAKETDRIEATVDALRALGAARPRDRGRLPGPRRPDPPARRPDREPRRPPDRDARRVAGLVSREGVEIEGAECVAVSFPGFFELAAQLARSTRRPSRCRLRDPARGNDMIVAIDGPAGAGKSTVARALARAARLPLPRHRRDVPRADLARARARRRRSTTATALARARARASRSTFGERRRRVDRRARRDGRDPGAGDRPLVPIVARHPEVREVMRERQRALGEQGDSVIEGRDIGTVVAPARRGEGLPRRRPGGARARRHAERDGIERRGARRRSAAPRRARRAQHAPGRRRRRARHDGPRRRRGRRPDRGARATARVA